MANENPRELFQSIEQLAASDKIRESLDPAKCLAAATQIRTQADRIGGAARRLTGGEKEVESLMTSLADLKAIFGPMEGAYRGMCGILAGLANKELAAVYSLTMPADRLYARAHFWRSRVLADMFAASSYYKVSAELISLAMKTLDKCFSSKKADENILLLWHTSALLTDAATFMATAGAELGDNNANWRNLEDSVKQLYSRFASA